MKMARRRFDRLTRRSTVPWWRAQPPTHVSGTLSLAMFEQFIKRFQIR